jgi:hypothetical protein
VDRDAQSAKGLCELVHRALTEDQLQDGAAAMKAAFADLPDVSDAVPLLERLAGEKTPIAPLLAAEWVAVAPRERAGAPGARCASERAGSARPRQATGRRTVPGHHAA